MMMMTMMSILTSASLLPALSIYILLIFHLLHLLTIPFFSTHTHTHTHSDDMELEDAIHTALLTLKESYDGEMDEHNIEVAVVSDEDKLFKLLTPQEVKDFLDEAT